MKAKVISIPRRGILVLAAAVGLSVGIGWWYLGGPKTTVTVDPKNNAAALVPLRVSKPGGSIRSEVMNAVGDDPAVTPIERLDLLRRMGPDLNPDERDALLAVLSTGRPPNVPAGWHSEHVHEISKVLQRQPQGQDKFARVLAAAAADPGREEVVRDYAMQHLRILWQSGEKIEGLRPGIEATFRQFADNDPVLSASALLSLHLLGTLGFDPVGDGPATDAPPTPDRFALPNQQLEPVVVEILRQPPTSTNVKVRMTALRVIRERRLGKQTEVVTAVCRNPSEHALIRMAAIPTLAALEGKAAISHLESLDRSDPRIESAVRHALAGIR